MHVVKRDQITGADRRPERISFDTVGLEYPPHAHMSRYDGVRDAGQTSLMQMDIGTAHLTGYGLEENPSRFEIGIGNIPDLERPFRLGHNGSADGHVTLVRCLSC